MAIDILIIGVVAEILMYVVARYYGIGLTDDLVEVFHAD